MHPKAMLFLIDFDGTLAVNDSVDALLERFAPDEWRTVEQEWLDGRITAMQCMREQIRMVRADHVQLEAFFRGVQLDASFLPFLRHVRAFADVAIVSDGLDHAVRVASKAAGMPELPVYANRLHFVRQGLDLSFPDQATDCASGSGVCKCAVSASLAKASAGPVVLVGDGKSDNCLASRVDVVFAKSVLAAYCQKERIAFHPFNSFADVLAAVRKWPTPVAAHSQIA